MGPLSGYRVLEVAGIGPGPFAAMMLADMGAEVLRLDRVGSVGRGSVGLPPTALDRGRRSVGVNMKEPEGVETVLRLVERADVLTEGFRPGVMERLGLGPDTCLARNPKLVYGRMTGFGQEGPLASAAGHDIDYIAVAGALHHFGPAGGPPVAPINLVGDFGGGGMFLAFGVVCALLETQRSGQGQVVDAAMVDGAAALMGMIFGMRSIGFWNDERGTNLIDGGAPFYGPYQSADGEHVVVGALEPQFYAELVERLGVAGEDVFSRQHDRSTWPAMRARLTELFAGKTRDEWCAVFDGSDACFAPVLSMAEAPGHPHNELRGTFVEVDGVVQPAPAPRFSRTPGAIAGPPVPAGADTDAALTDWGFAADEIAKLRGAGAVG